MRLLSSFEMARLVAVLNQKESFGIGVSCENLVSASRYSYLKFMEDLSEKDKEIVRYYMSKMDVLDLKSVDFNRVSGGQQQRVNVCIAFAMHDLVSSSKTSINLLVMDEKFEGLDADGTEAAFELIRAKAEDKSVYVITHSHIIDVLNSKTIEIAMENGTTVISEN